MKQIFYFTLLIIMVACSESESSIGDGRTNDFTNEGWLIPIVEVKDGGPGKDGIPSIENAQFVEKNNSEASYLSDDDLIIGIADGNDIKAYPHIILDWHEIVNDDIAGLPVTISYCPLTGTAFGWSSTSNETKTTFGVSGLLFNANLILYDRNTDSHWSQLKLECVNGELIGEQPKIVPIVETTWKEWKIRYPNTKVMSLDTGFSRNYTEYPYGPYKTNNEYFVFRAFPANEALPNKKRVHAILDEDNAKVYQFDKFTSGKALIENFKGNDYLVVGNQNLIISFKLNEESSNLTFEYNSDNSEVFFTDNQSNKYSAFGKIVEGPKLGKTLRLARSVNSYWFALAAFYPDPEIF